MNIHILKNRSIHTFDDSDISGIQNESNAETMYFTFPNEIAGIDIKEFTKWILFDIEGLEPQQIIDNQYSLTQAITQHESVRYQILLKHEEIVLFKSAIACLDFKESLQKDVIINLEDLSVLNQLVLETENLKQELEKAIENGISDVSDLKKQIEELENSIKEAENLRNEALAELERNVVTTINELKHTIEEYNTNAEDKLKELEDFTEDMKNAMTFATFSVNPMNGHIYMNTESSLKNMRFKVKQDGHLYVQI